MEAATASSASSVVSKSDRKDVLIGHIVSTLTANETIEDADMEMPKDGASGGHNVHGRTIALHSLAVLPDYQGKGYGSVLLADYIKRMSQQGVYDRIAIITYDDLVPFYEKHGFRNLGPGKAQFGGGGWVDMVVDLEPFVAEYLDAHGQPTRRHTSMAPSGPDELD